MRDREETVWVIFEASKELPGVWTAHCLTFDIVTQGDSLERARAMVIEAIVMTVNDDLEEGRDPFDRKTVPEDEWDRVTHAMRHGRRYESLSPEEQAMVTCLISPMTLRMPDAHAAVDEIPVPPAWQIACFESMPPSRISSH